MSGVGAEDPRGPACPGEYIQLAKIGCGSFFDSNSRPWPTSLSLLHYIAASLLQFFRLSLFRFCLHFRGPGIQTKITLDSSVPGIVITAIQIHPSLIAHLTPPLQKRNGIGSHRVAQLPGVALGELQNLLRDQRGWRRIFQRRREQAGEPITLPVDRILRTISNALGHGRVNDARLGSSTRTLNVFNSPASPSLSASKAHLEAM